MQNLKGRIKLVEKKITFGVPRGGGQEDREMKKLLRKDRLPVTR